jgi:hypothetical protein
MATEAFWNVVQFGLNTPPGSPAANAEYLTGAAPTGVWALHPNKIARETFGTGEWAFFDLALGHRIYAQDLNAHYFHDGLEPIRASAGAAFSAKLTANQTVTASYADIVGWDGADLIDSNTFSWVAATGILTVNRKIRKLQIEAAIRIDYSSGSASNCATVKLQRDPGTGSWADVAGTETGAGVSSATALNINASPLRKLITASPGHRFKLQVDQNTGGGVMVVTAAGTTLAATEIL